MVLFIVHGTGDRKTVEIVIISTVIVRDMKNKFPDYRHNPYIGFFKPKGQTLKIRIGVGTFMLLHKIRQ